MHAGRHIAVVGGGWAGLAAAVEATSCGAQVTVLEAAPLWGGRARSDTHDGQTLDNGQHILIGAYQDTLSLMRQVGADPDALLHRAPLQVVFPDNSGLRLGHGHPVVAFARGVLRWKALPLADRLRVLAIAASWRMHGFTCAQDATVRELCASLPARAWRDLIEPLTVAALNTPADQASAQVLLTVLKDALFGPPGSADLLLPKAPLHALLPGPALAWLNNRGARLEIRHRVHQIASDGARWRVDGEAFDAVVLACPPREASRLVAEIAPAWADAATAFRYQPIITAWFRAHGARWPAPMLAFRSGPTAPAQFGFDLGQLGGETGLFSLVVSGAAPWVEQGAPATQAALCQQMRDAFAGQADAWPTATSAVQMVAMRTEKRATFACTPDVRRPSGQIAPGLVAAGDHVLGPYPATLEGAVRSGRQAIHLLAKDLAEHS